MARLDSVATADIDALAVTEAKLATSAAAKLNATGRRNLIDNGDMQIWQRGSSITSTSTFPNTDGKVCADRWILLSETGDDRFDITRADTADSSLLMSRYFLQMDTETVEDKGAIFQVIQGAQSRPAVLNGTVSLSFWAKVSNTRIASIRYGVMEWSSTEDAVTVDPISSWESDTIEPNLVANWAWAGTSSTSTPTTGWVEYKLQNISLTATTDNLAVFIGIDDPSGTLADTLDISMVQLETGAISTAYEHRSFTQELSACQFHFNKTFDYGTAPITNLGASTGGVVTATGNENATSQDRRVTLYWPFPTAMLKAPTIVFYGPGSSDQLAVDTTTGGFSGTLSAYGTGTSSTGIKAAGNNNANGRWEIHATAETGL